MRTLRFHGYGEPKDVLRLEDATPPEPGPGHVRLKVLACGLTPADWALCRGLFPGDLPRGIGLEVCGTVDAIGAGVTGVNLGDRVLGATDFAGYPSAGAADQAVVRFWAPLPDGLDPVAAAALPMAVETAFRSLEALGVSAGQTVLVSGAGTTVGFAAVQIALLRRARVIATAGETYAERLRALGVLVTPYGKGLSDRVAEPVDLVFDTAPPSGVMPDLVHVAGGDPRRVLTVSDVAGAAEVGARTSFGEDPTLRYDALGEFAELAAEGRFSIPIAGTYPLKEWATATEQSLTGHARGKLLLVP